MENEDPTEELTIFSVTVPSYRPDNCWFLVNCGVGTVGADVGAVGTVVGDFVGAAGRLVLPVAVVVAAVVTRPSAVVALVLWADSVCASAAVEVGTVPSLWPDVCPHVVDTAVNDGLLSASGGISVFFAQPAVAEMRQTTVNHTQSFFIPIFLALSDLSMSIVPGPFILYILL